MSITIGDVLDTLRTQKKQKTKTRMELLEEFVRAYLWQDNYISNCYMSADGNNDSMEEYDKRTLRVQQALENLPQDLFAEVYAEDAVIYKDVEQES